MEEKPRRTPAQAANDRREAKLADVREQVERGTLVIRQMTDAERAQYPPRPKPPNRRTR